MRTLAMMVFSIFLFACAGPTKTDQNTLKSNIISSFPSPNKVYESCISNLHDILAGRAKPSVFSTAKLPQDFIDAVAEAESKPVQALSAEEKDLAVKRHCFATMIEYTQILVKGELDFRAQQPPSYSSPLLLWLLLSPTPHHGHGY